MHTDSLHLIVELRDRGAAVGLPRVLGSLQSDDLGVTARKLAQERVRAAMMRGQIPACAR